MCNFWRRKIYFLFSGLLGIAIIWCCNFVWGWNWKSGSPMRKLFWLKSSQIIGGKGAPIAEWNCISSFACHQHKCFLRTTSKAGLAKRLLKLFWTKVGPRPTWRLILLLWTIFEYEDVFFRVILILILLLWSS